MQKVQFSPRVIESLPQGQFLADPKTPGLGIEADRGRLMWRFKRKVRGTQTVIKKTFGSYPALSIADAREAAAPLNKMAETGVNPKEAAKAAAIEGMTVGEAHALYMTYVKAGDRKVLKPRSIEDKERLYRAWKDAFEGRALQSITDDDLWSVVEAKAAAGARIRANRIGAEMKVFFGWCASRAGKMAGIVLKDDPSRTLSGTYFGKSVRSRILSDAELPLFLRALADQERDYVRAIGLILVTGTRKMEVIEAASNERRGDLWTIPAARYKSNHDHVIPLSPWGRSLMEVNTKFVVQAKTKEKPISECWINKVLEKVRTRMMEIGEVGVPHFTVHDLRRTMRSNTKRLKIDRDTAEAMMGHTKKELDYIYDLYQFIDEKREGFAKWEAKIVDLAREAGVAEALQMPA